jgi:hypothetical protein
LIAALVVLLQGGGMATENARLWVGEDLWLDQKSPAIAFLCGWYRDAKNEGRPRFIPIVFGLALFRDKLPEGVELLANRGESLKVLHQEQLRKLLT